MSSCNTQVQAGMKRPLEVVLTPDTPEFDMGEGAPSTKRQLTESLASQNRDQPAPFLTSPSSPLSPTDINRPRASSLHSPFHESPPSPYPFPQIASRPAHRPHFNENYPPDIEAQFPLSYTLANSIISMNYDLVRQSLDSDPLLTSLCASRLASSSSPHEIPLNEEERRELEQLRLKWARVSLEAPRRIAIAGQTISALKGMLSKAEMEKQGLKRDVEGLRRQVFDQNLQAIRDPGRSQHEQWQQGGSTGPHRGFPPYNGPGNGHPR